LGWQTALVSTSYSAALAVQGMIALNVTNYAVPAWHGVVLTIGAVLVTIIFNTVLLRKLPTLEGGMLVLHVFAFIAIFTILWVMGDRAPASEVFLEWSDPQGWGSVQLPYPPNYVLSLTSTLAVRCSDLYWIVIGYRFPSRQRQCWYVCAQ
jgi:choline transport protein